MESLEERINKKRATFEKEYLKHPKHKFLDEIWKMVNIDRKDTKYKPLSKKILAIKIAHLSTDDISFLVKRMQQSSNPGKVFFGSLKSIKEK